MKYLPIIIIAFSLFAVASAASNASNASSSNSNYTLMCIFFKYCPHPNVTTTIPFVNPNPNVTNTTTNKSNTSIITFGNATQTYASGGQYVYLITLQKNNQTPSGIYSFALLGTFDNIKFYVPAAGTNCSITTGISCTATFIVNVGSYQEIEVINNGQWLYAIKLPNNIVTKQQYLVIVTTKKPWPYTPYVVWSIVLFITVMVSGNVIYDQYMWKFHQDAYYRPTGYSNLDLEDTNIMLQRRKMQIQVPPITEKIKSGIDGIIHKILGR